MPLPERVRPYWTTVFGSGRTKGWAGYRFELLGWFLFLVPLWGPFVELASGDTFGYDGSWESAILWCLVGYGIIRFTRRHEQIVAHVVWVEKDAAFGSTPFIARCECGWQGDYYSSQQSAADQARGHCDVREPELRVKAAPE